MSIIISDETGEPIELGAEWGKLEMIGLTRSSSQEVAEGYGRSIFAEFFDLYVTVHPEKFSKGYDFNMTLNVPLEMDGYTANAYDMVFSPPRGG